MARIGLLPVTCLAALALTSCRGRLPPASGAETGDAGTPVEDAGTAVADAGGEDAGYDDAGPQDAGHDDAGHDDAGHDDAGHDDAGHDDAGHDDAGHDDAGGLARTRPTRVILFIGDGMAEPQAVAARMKKNGDTAPLVWETFAVRGAQRTANVDGAVTDSAAAATAMATGVRVKNGVIATGSTGEPLVTVLELAKRAGKRTGLVSVATPLTDATPAAFGAHEPSRGNSSAIAQDYVVDSRPDVLFGEVATGLTGDVALGAGYDLVTTPTAFAALDPAAAGPVAALFTPAHGVPSLASLTATALAVLDRSDAGFFLLVEHEGTDNEGHENDLAGVIDAALALEAAVELAVAFAAQRDDVLIIVTGDHETGGLQILDDAPAAGLVPLHRYTTTGHTGVDVPVHAMGPGATALSGTYDNTHLFTVLSNSDVGLP
jgi:alkaline phosphatase